MLRCPVEETGRNSVMPSTMPRMTACSQFMWRLPGVRAAVAIVRLPVAALDAR